jgi:hypothetical protein
MIIKKYEHGPDGHTGFVLSSFCLQLGEPDWVLRDLIQDGAEILVMEAPTARRDDGSPLCYGWAGKHSDALVYTYVKDGLRKFPVVPNLLDALGFDRAAEIPVRFLSRQVKAIGRHWNLNFVPTAGTN